jgi:hypothetical protein
LRTKLLVLASDVCRDIKIDADLFVTEARQRSRLAKRMAVPTCTLVETVVRLLRVGNDKASRHAREGWPDTDKKTYRDAGRRLKKRHLRGPVRRVRNKLGAHLDPDAIGDGDLVLRTDDLLAAIGDSLVVLMLAMNLPSPFFAWIRSLGPSEDSTGLIVETMFSYPVTVRWITDHEGHVKDVGSMHVAADPRHDIQRHVLIGTAAYNSMVKAAGSSLPVICTTPTEESRDAEQHEMVLLVRRR